jgi:hypothetical protein
MTEPAPPTTDPKKDVTPLRCLLGSSISAALAWGLYSLTSAIAITFATKPILFQNQIVQRIGSAVRTLVLGVASMATFIFGFVAIGLILLAIQLVIQSLVPKKAND